MSVELRPPRRGRARYTFFVGRRPHEAAEVHAVTDDDVRRLRPNRRGGPLALDWHAGDARAVELMPAPGVAASRSLLAPASCVRRTA
jgi:hypothetical protein